MEIRFNELTLWEKIEVGTPTSILIAILAWVLIDPGKASWPVLVLATGLVAVIGVKLHRIRKRLP